MNRILAIYRDQSRAALATRELQARGIAPEQISLIAADSASGQLFIAKQRSASRAGATEAIGSTNSLNSGPGLGAGAIFTGPIAQVHKADADDGLLVQMGIPATEAVLRSREILDGAILLGVDAEDSAHRSVTEALGATDYLHFTSIEQPKSAGQKPHPPTANTNHHDSHPHSRPEALGRRSDNEE